MNNSRMKNHGVAQTNIQLFNQLLSDGYSNSDVILISDSYRFALPLFSGRHKPAGKTFISHLIGTASIIASLHVATKLVAAGLLHAVYTLGDFGDGRTGISDSKREMVKKTAGDEVEEYVARYAALNWNWNDIVETHGNIHNLDEHGREVLLIRLANELEEHLDLAALYCPNVPRRLQYANEYGHLVVKMAQTLGFPPLAADLDAAFKETISAEIPEELCGRQLRNASFVIPPKSYEKRMSLKFSFWLHRASHALRQKLSVLAPLRRFLRVATGSERNPSRQKH